MINRFCRVLLGITILIYGCVLKAGDWVTFEQALHDCDKKATIKALVERLTAHLTPEELGSIMTGSSYVSARMEGAEQVDFSFFGYKDKHRHKKGDVKKILPAFFVAKKASPASVPEYVPPPAVLSSSQSADVSAVKKKGVPVLPSLTEAIQKKAQEGLKRVAQNQTSSSAEGNKYPMDRDRFQQEILTATLRHVDVQREPQKNEIQENLVQEIVKFKKRAASRVYHRESEDALIAIEQQIKETKRELEAVGRNLKALSDEIDSPAGNPDNEWIESDCNLVELSQGYPMIYLKALFNNMFRPDLVEES